MRSVCSGRLIILVLICGGLLSPCPAVENFKGATIHVASGSSENGRAITFEDIQNFDLARGGWITTQGYGTSWIVGSQVGDRGAAVATLDQGTRYGRALVYAIKDDRATKFVPSTGGGGGRRGGSTVEVVDNAKRVQFDLLMPPGHENRNFTLRVIGIQDSEGDGWTGGIQGAGGASVWGSEQSAQYVNPPFNWNSGLPDDGTNLLIKSVRNGDISFSSDWQRLSFEVDFGDGYDWILISFAIALGGSEDYDNPEELIGLTNVAHPWTDPLDPNAAYDPQPARGQVMDSELDAITLSWKPGDNAVKHNVYLGASKDNLTLVGDAQDVNTYDVTSFGAGETFYWQIGELQADESETLGPIWNFSTASYLIVDDFEGYGSTNADWDNGVTMAWDVWTDGLGDNQSGSQVGYDEEPYLASNPTYAGSQSLPMKFGNSLSWQTSEISREVGNPDWTRKGVRALFLAFRGDKYDYSDFSKLMPTETDVLYVGIEDGNGNKSFLNWPGPVTDLMRPQWFEWNIALRDFAGVNLSDVKKFTLGIGNRLNPAKGGFGTVWFDEIRLYQPRPVADMAQPPEDLDNDADVDEDDRAVLLANVADGQLVTPRHPGTSGLKVHCKFEGNLNDVYGNIGNAVSYGDVMYGPGVDGQALELNGFNAYGDLGFSFGSTAIVPLKSFSSSQWVKGARVLKEWPRVWEFGSSNEYVALLPYHPDGGPRFELHMTGYGETDGHPDKLVLNAPAGTITEDEWACLVTSLDEATDTLVMYVDGKEVARHESFTRTPNLISFYGQNLVGSSNDGNHLMGAMDDLCFYNRALSQADAAGLAGLTEPVSTLAMGEQTKSDLNGDGSVNAADEAILEAALGTVLLWPTE